MFAYCKIPGQVFDIETEPGREVSGTNLSRMRLFCSSHCLVEVRKLVLECEASLVNSTFPDWHWTEQDPETGEPVVTPDPDTGKLGPAWREWGTLIPPCGQYQSHSSKLCLVYALSIFPLH